MIRIGKQKISPCFTYLDRIQIGKTFTRRNCFQRIRNRSIWHLQTTWGVFLIVRIRKIGLCAFKKPNHRSLLFMKMKSVGTGNRERSYRERERGTPTRPRMSACGRPCRPGGLPSACPTVFTRACARTTAAGCARNASGPARRAGRRRREPPPPERPPRPSRHICVSNCTPVLGPETNRAGTRRRPTSSATTPDAAAPCLMLNWGAARREARRQ